MPAGGEVQCAATLANAPEGAQVQGRKTFDGCGAADHARPGERHGHARPAAPLTPAHILEVAVRDGDREFAFERLRFTMSVPYPFDDFTALMWSYAGGDPLLLRTDRMCYEWGADLSDLCHMGGYDDRGAAREYSVSARSGLRLIPYVTRIAGEANPQNERIPCLHDPEYWGRLSRSLTTTCRQAAPYSPGLHPGRRELPLPRQLRGLPRSGRSRPLREWLRERYGTIAALNAEWGADYHDFAAIERPMLPEEAATQTTSFAPGSTTSCS